MFQLGVLFLLSMAVSLSSGQDVTLSESSSSSGTCNITSYRNSGGATVSCDVNTCFEAFNGSRNCFSFESIFTCSQRSEGSGSSFYNTFIRLGPEHRPFRSFFLSGPYVCLAQGDVCLCRSSNESDDSESLLGLLSIGFGLVLLFLPIIIFFNINLASGPNHSFVFFYQCAPLASVYVSPAAFLVMQNYILPAQPRFIVLEYCKYIVVLFVIFFVFFLVKCTCCPLQKCRLPWAKVRRAVRNFREKHIGSTFIHAICSIIVLSYGDLVAVSARIAHGLIFVNRSCCYSVSYNDNASSIYTYSYATPVPCDESYTIYFDWSSSYIAPLVTILVFVTLLLLLPLSLIYYPSIPALFHKLTGRSLPRFPKLDPVFDVFQGVYKDKMRWFAGVYLLYLMILWTVFIVLPDVLPFVFVFILAIHSLLQPFKNRLHNYLETLYLVYLVLIFFASSSLQILNLSSTVTIFGCVDRRDDLSIIGIILTGCLISLPTLLVFVYYSYNKLFSKCLCCQRCAAKMKNCYTKSEDKEEVEVEVQLKEYEEAQPEEEQQEDDHPYYVAEWSS